jgi:hypothetical protein
MRSPALKERMNVVPKKSKENNILLRSGFRNAACNDVRYNVTWLYPGEK